MPRVLSRKSVTLHTAHGTSVDGYKGHVVWDIPDDILQANQESAVWISNLSLQMDADIVDSSNSQIGIVGIVYTIPTGRPTLTQILSYLNDNQSSAVFIYHTAKHQIQISSAPGIATTVPIDFSVPNSCADLLGFEKIIHYVSQYGGVINVFPINLGVSQLIQVRSNIGSGSWESRPDGIVSGDTLATIPINPGSFNAVLYTDEIGLHRVLLTDQGRLTNLYIKITDALTGKIIRLKQDYVITLTIESTDYTAKRLFESTTQKALAQIAELSKLNLLQATL